MSHFSVIVVGPDPEGQLAPFDESLAHEPYRDPAWDATEALASARSMIAQDPTIAVDITDEAAVLGWVHSWDFEEGLIRQEDGAWVRYSTYNPLSKWDWYQLGGRFDGHFQLLPGRIGLDGGTERTSQVLRGDLDFAAMRDAATRSAAEYWEQYEQQLVLHGPLPEMPSTDDREVWDRYRAHPAIAALRQALGLWFETPNEFFCHGDRDLFFRTQRLAAVPGYALLADGAWAEPGRMGWFGVSSETPESRFAYLVKANAVLDNLPPDTLVSLFDCHI